jgi:RNA polymerase sigma-70 factor (ECF subfamily)
MKRLAPVFSKVNPRQRQFEALTRAHAGDLYRFAYWLCGQDALAQDLVQETLLRAWKNLDALREAEAAKPWLLTILRREHARLHERRSFDTTELDDELAEDAAWASPERHGDAAQLREAMHKLPHRYREPLLLQVLGGLSCEEISAELGQQPGAVMTQLFRARQKLKAILHGERAEVQHGLS